MSEPEELHVDFDEYEYRYEGMWCSRLSSRPELANKEKSF